MPDFEVLYVKIASALKRIIRNTRFKKKVSLEEQNAQKEDRFFRGRQIAYLIYEYFQVTGANDSVENYADLFTIVLRNDAIQEFHSKWDGILLSMTKIPSDDILEGLWEIVGNGKPTGSVLKETMAVSVTMSMSVEKSHSRILL